MLCPAINAPQTGMIINGPVEFMGVQIEKTGNIRATGSSRRRKFKRAGELHS